jgi:NAD(P)H-dependent flavin oxidoreductase YrpB (nitropropane dioxygenase family)
MGTRFEATHEALVEPAGKRAIIEGSGEDTERSRVLDIARGVHWPHKYTGRTLRNSFLEQWLGREEELVHDEMPFSLSSPRRREVTSSQSGRARGSTSSPILLQPLISWP